MSIADSMSIADEFFPVDGQPNCVLHLQVDPPVLMSNECFACAYRLSVNGEQIAAYHIYGTGHLQAILLTLGHVADLMKHWATVNHVRIASGVWDDLRRLCTLDEPQSG